MNGRENIQEPEAIALGLMSQQQWSKSGKTDTVLD